MSNMGLVSKISHCRAFIKITGNYSMKHLLCLR